MQGRRQGRLMEKKRQDAPETPAALAEKEIDGICMALRESRNQPLLILYYPDGGSMREADVEAIYGEFRRLGYSKETKMINELDVLIHTAGGSPQAGYMAAQVLRRFASSVNFLVPYRAANAGTLMCLCADSVSLGAFAYLSPIDVLQDGALNSVDYFTDFAVQCRLKTESALRKENTASGVESDLLAKFLDKVGPAGVAELYRQRTIAAKYAYRLLSDYMFASEPNREEKATQVSEKLLFNYPAGDFYMDHHICKVLGLKTSEMSEDDSDMTRRIVKTMDKYTQAGVICKATGKDGRAPFITLYGET